jgi:hypothetical protein
LYDNATATRRRASLLFPPPPALISNRKSGIRNPNNHCVFNRFHFSNRKYSAISHHQSASHSSLATALLIETPRLKIPISRPISTTSNFLIETKCGFGVPNISAGTPLSAPPYLPIAHHSSLIPCHSACLRVPVPPRPIFAIMAGSN